MRERTLDTGRLGVLGKLGAIRGRPGEDAYPRFLESVR
jgi:hypothetical protein